MKAHTRHLRLMPLDPAAHGRIVARRQQYPAIQHFTHLLLLFPRGAGIPAAPPNWLMLRIAQGYS